MVECYSAFGGVALALSIFVLVCSIYAVNIYNSLVILVPLITPIDLQDTRIRTSLNLMLAFSPAVHKNFFPVSLIASLEVLLGGRVGK